MRFLIGMPISPFLVELFEAEGHSAIHAATLVLLRRQTKKS